MSLYECMEMKATPKITLQYHNTNYKILISVYSSIAIVAEKECVCGKLGGEIFILINVSAVLLGKI